MAIMVYQAIDFNGRRLKRARSLPIGARLRLRDGEAGDPLALRSCLRQGSDFKSPPTTSPWCPCFFRKGQTAKVDVIREEWKADPSMQQFGNQEHRAWEGFNKAINQYREST